jgi:AcrR family transcriptional regulator
VHYAFRDKSELLQAVTDELLEQFERALRARVEVGQGLRRTLAGLLAGYWAWVSSEPGLARAVVATALAGAPGTALATSAPASGGPATRPHAVDAGRRLVLDALRTAGEEPTRVDLDDLAHLVLVAIDGLTVVYLLDGDSARAERSIDQLVDALSTLC